MTKEEIRSNRKHLAGEHAFTDIGQLILFAVFMLVWITDSVLGYSVLYYFVPIYIRIPVGLAILAISAMLALTAHDIVFGKTAPKEKLFTQKVFALVRHPMYLGEILTGAAVCTWRFSLANLILFTTFLSLQLFRSRIEERKLLQFFREEYSAFASMILFFFRFFK